MSNICPLCQAAGTDRPYLQYDVYRWVECRSCTFVYQSPYVAEHNRIASEAEISRTYETFFDDTLPASVTAEKKDWVLRECAASSVVYIELGPGLGQLMDAVRSARSEWSFFAVEPHPPFSNTLRTKGFDTVNDVSELSTHPGLRESAARASEILVVADNVIEHVEGPVSSLRSLRELSEALKKPITVLVEVPNERGLRWRQSLQDWLRGFDKAPTFPGHINLFTSSTLARAAKDAGFEKIRVAGHGLRSRDQLEYLLRGRVQSELAPTVVRVLSVLPLDNWLGLAYWLRGAFTTRS